MQFYDSMIRWNMKTGVDNTVLFTENGPFLGIGMCVACESSVAIAQKFGAS